MSNKHEQTPLLHDAEASRLAIPVKWPLYYFPERVRPYLELIRLDKPTGTKLFFWPFVWGLTLAAYRTGLSETTYALELLRCLVSAFIIRGAACTINDIFDREFDAGVERTRVRPLPSGRISVRAATIWGISQLAFGVLFFSLLPPLAFCAAVIQLLPLSCIYPLLKRVTYWPQAWLGFTMNFGLVAAWATVSDTMDYRLMAVMVAGGWCWTMLYDTIYACQDMKDDVKVGVRSTALLFGTWIRPLLILCACGFAATLAYAGVLNEQGMPYFAITVGGTVAHLIWQFATVDLDNPESCWINFNRNGQLGWIVWVGLAADYLLKIHDITLAF
ncbi:4-hydroxybenzoate polyprenyl transferase [Punctularia strigosozonata HHB-11173 SS5]|uniref:4-hydroxybenzoate polyprenyl transferase n=1 Tax=Punctularia strigosozonata (strain HHB-11173) TaxID=741275 RepID=UPI0004417EE8|nr:4-hydroxybenzoate polyprenyl transferase [Punctularia strigosozonata HHB-11173 SS5]EIN14665.1 4-hydroxybenzoate polyprenyl transferase [Punctularia strigosozonata HHB-11173 SS5]